MAENRFLIVFLVLIIMAFSYLPVGNGEAVQLVSKRDYKTFQLMKKLSVKTIFDLPLAKESTATKSIEAEATSLF